MSTDAPAATIRLTISSGLGNMVMKRTGADGVVLRQIGANSRGLGGRFVPATPTEAAQFERAVAQRNQPV